MDIEAALGAARAMIGPDTLVLAIQNGLGNVERVQRALGPDNLLFGIAGGFGAEIKGPGHVHHNGMSTCTPTWGRWSGASWWRTSRSARSAR